MDPTQATASYPSHAGVSVKLARGVQGVSLEVDVKRLLQPHESYDDCAREAARIMIVAWREAQAQATAAGLTLGKDQARG